MLVRHHAHQAQAELTMVGSVAFVREEQVPHAPNGHLSLNAFAFALACALLPFPPVAFWAEIP